MADAIFPARSPRPPGCWGRPPLPASSMRTGAESGPLDGWNYNSQHVPGAALDSPPIREREREERGGEMGSKRLQCACVRLCSGTPGKDGGARLQLFADYIQVWKQPPGPPRGRGRRSSPLARCFSVLASGLMLPGGIAVGNRDGDATLQSHLRGPPAAWEQRRREAGEPLGPRRGRPTPRVHSRSGEQAENKALCGGGCLRGSRWELRIASLSRVGLAGGLLDGARDLGQAPRAPLSIRGTPSLQFGVSPQPLALRSLFPLRAPPTPGR